VVSGQSLLPLHDALPSCPCRPGRGSPLTWTTPPARPRILCERMGRMNPRKQRFYIAAAGLLAVIALAWSLIGSPVVLWHNHQLKAALTGLTDTTITLEQAVPFS